MNNKDVEMSLQGAILRHSPVTLLMVARALVGDMAYMASDYWKRIVS
jgi:hypothetical protein